MHIRQRTGSHSLAEEVLQETWIRANSNNKLIPDNPRAYLYRMANNLAIDLIRRETNKNAYSPPDNPVDSSDESQQISLVPSPEESVISRQELSILQTAIEELPEKCREVFLLYRGEGLTMRQIASSLSISSKTVEKHIARAMLHCRKRLQEAGRQI